MARILTTSNSSLYHKCCLIKTNYRNYQEIPEEDVPKVAIEIYQAGCNVELIHAENSTTIIASASCFLG